MHVAEREDALRVRNGESARHGHLRREGLHDRARRGIEAVNPGPLDAAGVAAATFDAAMRGVVFDAKVVERDRNQNEFSKTIWDYLDTAVSADRVALGLKAIAANRDLLDRIEAERNDSSKSEKDKDVDLNVGVAEQNLM